MSLASTSAKDDIKSIHSTQPGVVILNLGPNPSNTRQSLDCITMYANTRSLEHLLSAKFNQPAIGINDSNLLQRLERKEQEEKDQAEAAASPRSSPSSSSQQPAPTPATPLRGAWGAKPTVKLEYGPQLSTTSAGIVSYSASGPRTTSIAKSAVYFSDPFDSTGKAEHPDNRKARLTMWTFITAVCYHHAHLLSGLRVGDISGIVEAIRMFGMSHCFQDTLDSVTAMATLTKKGKTWQDFVAVVALIRNALDRESDPAWQIGALLLPGFIMRAMEADAKFEVELTLLRRTHPAPGVDHIMTTLGTKARELTNGSHKPLSGFAGGPTAPPPSYPPSTPAPVLTPTRGMELCRAFQRAGKCMYDQPGRGKWCKHSHGVANDIKRMAAKKIYTDKAAAKPKGKPTPSKAPTGCYRCASKNHGIDDCTEEVRAAVADPQQTPLPAAKPTPTIDAMATAIALAIQRGTAASPTGLIADPLGVGPNNTYGTIDHELAKIFASQKPANQ